MRRGLSWLLGAWLFAAAPIFAQAPPAPEGPGAPPGPALPGDPWPFWVRGEYVLYWVKNTPVPVSIVTGDPNNPTVELLNSDRGFGALPGFRVGLGIGLDPNNSTALETNFFALHQRARRFRAASDDLGNPTLAFPFIDQSPGAVGNGFMPITFPGVFAGNVAVSSTLQLLGAEANGALVLIPNQGGFEFTALAGFRYLNLREDLNISTVSAALMTDPPTVLIQSDQFNTRNQFYGGQVGGRLNWRGERFAVDLTGKLALGATRQTIDIDGFSAQTGPGGVNGVFPGGFFTQPSNMGRYSASQFSLVPSLEVKLYVFITSRLSAFIGYDYLYWTNVVRPGNQIDRNINLSQSSVLGGGALIGPASPAPLFNRSDFWAQGLNVGFEFKF